MYLSASTFVSVFHPNLISLSGRSYFLGNTEATFSPVFFTLHSVFKISVVVKQTRKKTIKLSKNHFIRVVAMVYDF